MGQDFCLQFKHLQWETRLQNIYYRHIWKTGSFSYSTRTVVPLRLHMNFHILFKPNKLRDQRKQNKVFWLKQKMFGWKTQTQFLGLPQFVTFRFWGKKQPPKTLNILFLQSGMVIVPVWAHGKSKDLFLSLHNNATSGEAHNELWNRRKLHDLWCCLCSGFQHTFLQL